MRPYGNDRNTHRRRGGSVSPSTAEGVREDIAALRQGEPSAWWPLCNESLPIRVHIGFARQKAAKIVPCESLSNVACYVSNQEVDMRGHG